ncbi:MAG: exodeoxyribonuclease VII small subunit [Bifidobacteriaceae bacterium]|jgi:exodeoxyribonuclease VII small subunit|nr:exodeoxyribonuclease VII small subunit [Bifidobacteriaceae bacterium]
MKPPVPAEDLTYEQARTELVQVVQELEAGSQSLEEAMTLWERGEALADRCREWLDGAQARIAAKTEPSAAPDPNDPSDPSEPTR